MFIVFVQHGNLHCCHALDIGGWALAGIKTGRCRDALTTPIKQVETPAGGAIFLFVQSPLYQRVMLTGARHRIGVLGSWGEGGSGRSYYLHQFPTVLWKPGSLVNFEFFLCGMLSKLWFKFGMP